MILHSQRCTMPISRTVFERKTGSTGSSVRQTSEQATSEVQPVKNFFSSVLIQVPPEFTALDGDFSSWSRV
jgi:hypothetical protein